MVRGARAEVYHDTHTPRTVFRNRDWPSIIENTSASCIGSTRRCDCLCQSWDGAMDGRAVTKCIYKADSAMQLLSKHLKTPDYHKEIVFRLEGGYGGRLKRMWKLPIKEKAGNKRDVLPTAAPQQLPLFLHTHTLSPSSSHPLTPNAPPGIRIACASSPQRHIALHLAPSAPLGISLPPLPMCPRHISLVSSSQHAPRHITCVFLPKRPQAYHLCLLSKLPWISLYVSFTQSVPSLSCIIRLREGEGNAAMGGWNVSRLCGCIPPVPLCEALGSVCLWCVCVSDVHAAVS